MQSALVPHGMIRQDKPRLKHTTKGVVVTLKSPVVVVLVVVVSPRRSKQYYEAAMLKTCMTFFGLCTSTGCLSTTSPCRLGACKREGRDDLPRNYLGPMAMN